MPCVGASTSDTNGGVTRCQPAGTVALSAASQESATSESWSFYEYPDLYDAAFGFRDFDSEVSAQCQRLLTL